MEAGMNMSDEALLRLSVKDLNKLLKILSQEDRNKLKKRRRILKNRGYAANCRTKRMSQKDKLQHEKKALESDIQKITHQNDMLNVQCDSIKQRLNDLQNYAKALKNKAQAKTDQSNKANKAS